MMQQKKFLLKVSGLSCLFSLGVFLLSLAVTPTVQAAATMRTTDCSLAAYGKGACLPGQQPDAVIQQNIGQCITSKAAQAALGVQTLSMEALTTLMRAINKVGPRVERDHFEEVLQSDQQQLQDAFTNFNTTRQAFDEGTATQEEINQALAQFQTELRNMEEGQVILAELTEAIVAVGPELGVGVVVGAGTAVAGILLLCQMESITSIIDQDQNVGVAWCDADSSDCSGDISDGSNSQQTAECNPDISDTCQDDTSGYLT